jgi:putative transposase
MATKKEKVASTKRKYAPEQKARLVLEIISGKRTVAEIARSEHIKDSVLYGWRNDVIEKMPLLFEMKAPDRAQNEREAELEQMIGQLTVEIQTLKKASRWLSGLSSKNGRS